jgi:hypothetical protein
VKQVCILKHLKVKVLTSGNYDIALGVGQSKLNSLASNFYNVIRTNEHLLPPNKQYLVRNYPVNAVGISSIDYDINTAPIINLLTPPEDDDSTAELTLSASISLGINYQNGANSTATVPFTVPATGKFTDKVIVTLGPASCSIPSSPLIQELVNKALLPSLVLPAVKVLITGLLSSVAIGNINLFGVTLMPPKICTINGYLLCYTALASPFSPPPTTGLPSDKLFAIISTSAISKLANANVKPFGPPPTHTTILGITFNASYTVTPSNIAVGAVGGSIIKVTGQVSGGGNVNYSFLGYNENDFNAQGYIAAEGSFTIDYKGNLNVLVSDVSINNLSFSMVNHGLAATIFGDLVNWLISLIINTGKFVVSEISINIPYVFPTNKGLDVLPVTISLSKFSYNGFDSNQSLLVMVDANFYWLYNPT